MFTSKSFGHVHCDADLHRRWSWALTDTPPIVQQAMLDGEFGAGDTVEVAVDDGRLSFRNVTATTTQKTG